MHLRRHAYSWLNDEALLARLLKNGPTAEAAWHVFLERYSNLFLKVIWQFETDQDVAMERYLYVCSKLAANDRAILKRFRPTYGNATPKFSTWLYAVVRNLCVDAYRAAHGRRRYPRAIARLSPFDQRVFALYFWQGYTVEEIEHTLGEKPVGGTSVREALDRVDAHLVNPGLQHRQSPVLVPYEEGKGMAESAPPSGVEDAALIEQWLAVLPAEERLVVQLRFWEDMTGAEIAKVLAIDPPQRVYTILKRALKQLRQQAPRDVVP